MHFTLICRIFVLHRNIFKIKNRGEKATVTMMLATFLPVIQDKTAAMNNNLMENLVGTDI